MGSKLTQSRYKAIVADVIRLFNDARNRLAGAYWKTGQYVVEIEQGGDPRARYGARTLANFSEELTDKLGSGFSIRSLERMRAFYLENRKSSPATELPWAHQIELLPVSDVKIRRALETRALREGLTAKEVRGLVRHEAVRAQVAAQLKARDSGLAARDSGPEKNALTRDESPVPSPDLLKVPKLGIFGLCQLKDSNDTVWPEKDVLLLDHGFKAYRELTREESRGLKAGDLVEWTGTKLVKSRHTVKDLFTYRAYLESVVDGDTLWVMLATGMRGASRQKLRLRGIDCPEIDTEEGKKAKQFLEKVLKDVPSLSVISSKNPTYDRYEAAVFFMDKTGKEIYLNNLLLQEGYAVRVHE